MKSDAQGVAVGNATEHGKQVARFVAGLMPNKPTIKSSEWKNHRASVLIASDAPYKGVTTLATVSLSDSPAMLDGEAQDYGVELVSCYNSSIDGCIDAVLDAAFLVFEHGEELYPGAVLPDLIARRDISTTMKHFFLIAPFIFDDKLKSIATSDRETRYLLAVPISDDEMALAGTEGSEALDKLLEQAQIDVFDWNRESIVDD